MPDTALVSIVIPCYNHGEFLGEALRSIGTPRARTEIVVVDDGSRDSTPEVVATFETSNLFRGIRQPNAGLAAARNRGLRESHGEYAIFLDADDRLAPGAVDLGVSQLDQHPEAAFVFGRCTMMDREGTLLDTPVPPRIMRNHYRELLRRNYIWTTATVMFRRDPLRRVGGFNLAVNASADYEMYLHVARHYPVHDHGQVVAYYRKHDGNMSGNASRMLRETLAVLRNQRRFLEGDPESISAFEEGWRNWQEFYGAHLATEIRLAVRQHRLIDAVTKAVVLGRYHPRGLWHHARQKTARTVSGEAPEHLPSPASPKHPDAP